MERVKENNESNVYVDCYALIGSCDSHGDLDIMRNLDEVARNGARKPEKKTKKPAKEKEIFFKDFIKSVDGFARIIRYTITDDELNLIGMEEGAFTDGKK